MSSKPSPIKHDYYIICYPCRGNPNNNKVVVEQMPYGKFYSDIFVKYYGNYTKWGPYEQENWAVKDAIRLEDEISKLNGCKPQSFKRKY